MPNNHSSQSSRIPADMLHMAGSSNHCSSRSQEVVHNQAALLAILLDLHNHLQEQTFSIAAPQSGAHFHLAFAHVLHHIHSVFFFSSP